MNTTNLITDYIISGIIGILCLLIPYFMIDNSCLVTCMTIEVKNSAIIAIVIVVISYSFGIFFNQIADYLEKVFFIVLRNQIVDSSESKMKEEINVDHHYALQYIVAKSETAYDYISFRRTMIRIIRYLFSLTIIIPVLHIIYSIILKFSGKLLYFSIGNFFTCILIFLIGAIIINKILTKLYKGYYAAITNFYKVMNNGTFQN